jgi:phosphate starvation-inducible protein PhoH
MEFFAFIKLRPYLRPVYKIQSTVCDETYMENPFMALNKVELIMGLK